MKFLYFLTLSLFLTTAAFSQKEYNNWYFGNRAGVTFNTNPPTALTNGAMYQTEGCATRSDAAGNLLFYTNGVRVYNRLHTKMPNGDTLLGGNSSTQSAIIIPVQDNTTQFYIFTTQQLQDPQPTTSRYSIVDMTLDGGNGDVLIKNQLLHSGSTEKLTATIHNNKRDTWVMVHGYGEDKFYAYLVTPFGVTTTPVVSQIGASLSGARGVGQMKFSSDGTKLAHVVPIENYVALFDFDASTGMLSNYKKLPLGYTTNSGGLDAGANGLEFSPAGNAIYVTVDDSTSIYQWDISSNDETTINSTVQRIAKLNGRLFQLQHAPDHKIYFAVASADSIGVINYPNIIGTGCGVNEYGIYLGGKTSSLGLPSAIASDLFTVSIPKVPEYLDAGLYPNPAHDILNFNSEKVSTVSIFDASGRLVMNQSLSRSVNTIDISSFASGVYMVRMEDESKASQVVKLVVQ